MSEQHVPILIPTHSVMLHKNIDDLPSSDIASTGISVESECSSPCSTEMSVGSLGSEHVGEAALIAKNHAILVKNASELNTFADTQMKDPMSML